MRGLFFLAHKKRRLESRRIQAGAPERTRTSDARFRKPTLYPLSYGGKKDADITAPLSYHTLRSARSDLKQRSRVILPALSGNWRGSEGAGVPRMRLWSAAFDKSTRRNRPRYSIVDAGIRQAMRRTISAISPRNHPIDLSKAESSESGT